MSATIRRVLTPGATLLRQRSEAIVPVLVGCGLLESILVYFTHAWPTTSLGFLLWFGSRVIYVIITGGLILLCSRASRGWGAPAWSAWAVLGLGFFISVLMAQFVMEAFPNSGDEFGYNYIAETLLKGRVWNPSMPAGLHDIFETYYIGDRDGRRASQYPPGWPALLALFKVVHLGPLANAFTGLAASAFVWLALDRTGAARHVRVAVFALATLAPFALFNNASYYNHTLTALCLAGIIWLDLRDRTVWTSLVTGFFFSVLLTVRYETFLIAAALFGCDGLIRQRLQFIKPAFTIAAGAVPVAALLLWYNWRITGHPLETTLHWASPEISYGLHSVGMDGPHSLVRGLRHTLMWFLSWQDFASVLILPLYALALWRRVVTRTVRWFDLILPAIVVFFVFYPDFGGYQYGPRYWYFGYVALPVTIAAGLPAPGGLWTFGRWRLDPVRLCLLQMASFAGFVLGYAAFVHQQTEVRAIPFRIALTAPPKSLVLINDTPLPYVTWQFEDRMTVFRSRDFTRNGPDGLAGLVILGRAPETADQVSMLCRTFADWHVLRVVVQSPPPTGHLEPFCH